MFHIDSPTALPPSVSRIGLLRSMYLRSLDLDAAHVVAWCSDLKRGIVFCSTCFGGFGGNIDTVGDDDGICLARCAVPA